MRWVAIRGRLQSCTAHLRAVKSLWATALRLPFRLCCLSQSSKAHERTETLTGWHMFRTKTPTHMHLFSSFVSIVSKCHVTPRGCQRKDVIAYSMRHSNDSSQTHLSLAEWLEGKGKGSNEIDMWSSFLKGERFPKRSFVVSWNGFGWCEAGCAEDLCGALKSFWSTSVFFYMLLSFLVYDVTLTFVADQT